MKGELANKTVNYDTEINAFQFEPEVSPEQITGATVSNKYQIRLKKKYLLPRTSAPQ